MEFGVKGSVGLSSYMGTWTPYFHPYSRILPPGLSAFVALFTGRWAARGTKKTGLVDCITEESGLPAAFLTLLNDDCGTVEFGVSLSLCPGNWFHGGFSSGGVDDVSYSLYSGIYLFFHLGK